MPKPLPGTTGEDYRKPVCTSGHDPSLMVKEPEGWACLGCFEFFANNLKELSGKTRGGVVLPPGVEHQNVFARELFPNRRTRRRNARVRRS